MSPCRPIFSAGLLIAMLFATLALAGSRSDGQALLSALREADETRAVQLIDAHASVSERDEAGATALMWAIQRGSLDLVTRLLKAGADPNQPDSEGLAPLQLALGLQMQEIAFRMIESGADPNTVSENGESVLMTAARTGQLEVMKRLIARGANVNARESGFHQTALMWSAGHPEQTKLLMAHGADTKARTRVWKVTQTIYTHTSNGGDPYTREGEFVSDRGGQTALHFAVQEDDVESLKALLDAGLDVNDSTADGSTALLLALNKWNEGGKRYGAPCNDSAFLMTPAPNLVIANLLLDHGARVTVADTAGYTPLHGATLALIPRVRLDKCRILSNRTQYAKYPDELIVDRTAGLALVQRLLEAGADPNATTRYPMPGPIGLVRLNPAPVGSAPVHMAAESANGDLMKLLLDRGGNPNTIRSDGHSPLSVAIRADDVPLATMLLARGASASRTFDTADIVIDAIGAGGAITATSARREQTLLHVAAAAGSHAVVPLLVQSGVALSARNDQGETALQLAQTQERLRYQSEAAAVAAPHSVDTRTSDAIQKLMTVQ